MEINRYLVKVNDNEEAFKLLKKMKAKSNITWASGDELDDEDILGTILKYFLNSLNLSYLFFIFQV